MNVLSTMAMAPCSWATAVAATRSVTSSSGFAGLSRRNALVLSVTAASKSCGRSPSTTRYVMPKLEKTWSSTRYVPPYTLRESTISSPAEKSESTAVMAAIPEAKAKPLVPPSSSAMSRSRAARVGLPVREYSHSGLPPTPCCRKVDVW